jgi:hypothetical protein
VFGNPAAALAVEEQQAVRRVTFYGCVEASAAENKRYAHLQDCTLQQFKCVLTASYLRASRKAFHSNKDALRTDCPSNHGLSHPQPNAQADSTPDGAPESGPQLKEAQPNDKQLMSFGAR